MSHSINAKSANQQRQSKVYFKQYLHENDESRGFDSKEITVDFKFELLENSFFMRRQFRRRAQTLRDFSIKQ